ncbi:MAG: sigma-70 family RNA polymerase sigma factor [Planctomycetota bacterium]
MSRHESAASSWLPRLRRGEAGALVEMFATFRPRLRRMIELYLDPRVASRLDPSDILQDAYLEAARRAGDYAREALVDPYVWLRGLTSERVVNLHRRHLGAQRRSVQRELPLDSSVLLATRLLAPQSSPSQAMMRQELQRRVQEGLARLREEDREVLVMRQFEGLSNGEVAQALGLSDSGASMRYGRALYRLKQVLTQDGPSGEERP